MAGQNRLLESNIQGLGVDNMEKNQEFIVTIEDTSEDGEAKFFSGHIWFIKDDDLEMWFGQRL